MPFPGRGREVQRVAVQARLQPMQRGVADGALVAQPDHDVAGVVDECQAQRGVVVVEVAPPRAAWTVAEPV